MKSMPRRERGIALLVALLTVALATILIAGLLDRGELALARTRNTLRGEQAQAYAQGLEAYAAEILMKDHDDDASLDTSTDIWALPLPPQQVPGGIISATVRDMNGCFNLNNLSSDNPDRTIWRAVFRRLLAVRGVSADLEEAVSSWLDEQGSADSADTYYLSLPVPYRRGRHAFAHVSELRLVRGVGSEVYAQLAPHVCALPTGTKLNVNTATVPVLQALGEGNGMTQAKAESVWQGGQAHWTSDFKQKWTAQGIKLDPLLRANQLATASSYFLARGDMTLDGVPFTFYSLMERRIGTGVRVLERSRGSDDALVAAALPRDSGAAVP
ncbi:MAG: type II secretion system minor pseudopilin GspK [Rhodanobacteraceae bacterium]